MNAVEDKKTPRKERGQRILRAYEIELKKAELPPLRIPERKPISTLIYKPPKTATPRPMRTVSPIDEPLRRQRTISPYT